MENRKQIGGIHYQKMTIEPVDFIMKNNLSFCQGNVIKYVCRYKDKDGIQDLLKAKQYIDFLIEEQRVIEANYEEAINDMNKEIDKYKNKNVVTSGYLRKADEKMPDLKNATITWTSSTEPNKIHKENFEWTKNDNEQRMKKDKKHSKKTAEMQERIAKEGFRKVFESLGHKEKRTSGYMRIVGNEKQR